MRVQRYVLPSYMSAQSSDECAECRMSEDVDTNAARNISQRALVGRREPAFRQTGDVRAFASTHCAVLHPSTYPFTRSR